MSRVSITLQVWTSIPQSDLIVCKQPAGAVVPLSHTYMARRATGRARPEQHASKHGQLPHVTSHYSWNTNRPAEGGMYTNSLWQDGGEPGNHTIIQVPRVAFRGIISLSSEPVWRLEQLGHWEPTKSEALWAALVLPLECVSEPLSWERRSRDCLTSSNRVSVLPFKSINWFCSLSRNKFQEILETG